MSTDPRPLVLIAEDNPDTAATYAALLNMHGYRPAVARDGWEAVRLAEQEPPSAAVLDIGLPILDGWGVARRLKQISGADIPFIVAVSAHATAADRDASKAAGIDAHIAKPADPQHLTRLLGMALRPEPVQEAQ